MKILILVCALAYVAITCARPDETYTDKYDGVDLDEILSNRRLLIPYVNCVLETGKCSPDGKELKSHIKEALENFCAKCTETQKKGTRKVIAHIVNHEQEIWKKLTEKYDPERKYVTKYEKEFKDIKL